MLSSISYENIINYISFWEINYNLHTTSDTTGKPWTDAKVAGYPERGFSTSLYTIQSLLSNKLSWLNSAKTFQVMWFKIRTYN